MNRIVECVPNFSEGRRPEVIRRIVEAMQAVPGVQILDEKPDADHNRIVITMAGTPEAVEEAAFVGIACAAQLINRMSTEANIRALALLMLYLSSLCRVLRWKTAFNWLNGWAVAWGMN